MDFTKLLSMLESGGLFFSRADRLGDPFEGSLPAANERQRNEYNETHSDGEFHVRQFRALRKWMMVSCWHMNKHESAAMWRLYARTDEAIAVCSTFEKLWNSLTARFFVGAVRYIDYEKDELPSGLKGELPNGLPNIFLPFVYKRMSFKHEEEVRAVFAGWPPLIPWPGEYPPWMSGELTSNGVRSMWDFEAESPPGHWHPVDLNALIDEIRIAPGSPSWFRMLVKDVIKRYALDKPVVQSGLDATPLY